MKLFSAAVFLGIAQLASAKDENITFRSRHTGKLPPVPKIDTGLFTAAEGATSSAETKSITFASTRTIGGNWKNYSPTDDSNVTFTSTRNIGIEDAVDTDSASYTAARGDHSGVTFSSTRSIGLFDEVETEEKDKYTLFSDATDEEDKAVTSATLVTFFVTWLVAMALGLIVGIFCFIRNANKNEMANDATEMAASDENNALPPTAIV